MRMSAMNQAIVFILALKLICLSEAFYTTTNRHEFTSPVKISSFKSIQITMSDEDHQLTPNISSSIESVKEQVTLDGKRSESIGTGTFLLTALVGVPIWLTVLLPLSAAYQVSKSILPSSSKVTENVEPVELHDDEDSFPHVSDIKPMEDRKYHVVLLGATGFTGKIAAMYIASKYGNGGDVKWAIAGRSQQKLDNLKNDIAKELGDDTAKKIDSIIVDTAVRPSIHKLVDDTRVVISTAGPFCKYGSGVVEFCSKYGTSYVDITGEIDWNKEMIMKWDETAQKTGAKIISLCGLDSIPWDLTVHKLNELLKSECNDELIKVQCYDDIKAGISGGTIDTMLHFTEGKYTIPRYQFDPYLRKIDGTKSNKRTKNNSPLLVKRDPESGKWLGPWIMASINGEVVKRSHALRTGGDQSLIYEESWVHKDFKKAFVYWFGTILNFTALLNPVTGEPLKKFLLPKPGEGPTEKQMKHGYMLLSAIGEGAKGNKVESAMYFPYDPAYRDTARMVVESGLCLAIDYKDLPKGGGFFSPAVGIGDKLLERLCNSGSKFAVRIKSKL